MIDVKKDWQYKILKGKDDKQYVVVFDKDGKAITYMHYLQGEELRNLIGDIAKTANKGGFELPGDYHQIPQCLMENVIEPNIKTFVFYSHLMAQAQMIEDPVERERQTAIAENVLKTFDGLTSKVEDYFRSNPHYYYNLKDSAMAYRINPCVWDILNPITLEEIIDKKYHPHKLDATMLLEKGDEYHRFRGGPQDFELQ